MGNSSLYPGSFRYRNRLRDDVDELNNRINQLNNEKSNLTNKQNNLVNRILHPVDDWKTVPSTSHVNSEYGKPLIYGIDSTQRPSGAGDVPNSYISANRDNQLLATDKMYRAEGDRYVDPIINNNATIKELNEQYLPKIRTISKNITDETNKVRQLELTGLEYSYSSVKQQNVSVENQIQQTNDDFQFTNENIILKQDNLFNAKNRNTYLYLLYFFMMGGLAIYLFTMNQSYSLLVKILLLLFFVIYPFFIYIFEQLVIKWGKYFGSLFIGIPYDKHLETKHL